MFLLVLAHRGSCGQRAIKWLVSYYFSPTRGAKHCDKCMYICLSVGLLLHIAKATWLNLFNFLCILPVAPPLVALQCLLSHLD